MGGKPGQKLNNRAILDAICLDAERKASQSLSSDIDTPAFNLKAVVRETGLKPDTLRAWERRYGLPRPQRTGGGHRLYSQREIDELKWLVARQHEGLSISRAVELWRRLDAAGEDPLRMPAYSRLSSPPPAMTIDGSQMVNLGQAWVAAVLAFDEASAERTLAQAFAIYPTEDVCSQVLQAGLARIGNGWYQGSITIHQEHFASSLATRKLEALSAAAPPPNRPDRLLVGCPPEEWHTFAPLLVRLLLQRRGWPVTYLGANVPIDRVRETVQQTRPALSIFVAQRLQTAATLRGLALCLGEAGLPVAYGGRVFDQIPALRDRMPGVFLGENLGQVPSAVEGILTDRPSEAPLRPVDRAYPPALAQFQERRGRIESTLFGRRGELGMKASTVTEFNDHLGGAIVAGLTLGDLDLITAEITWVQGLMANRRLPAQLLGRYLTAYQSAAADSLDARGAPIVAWLERAGAS